MLLRFLLSFCTVANAAISTVKNANSATSMTTSLFRSRSRIALTGSPLANNVAEYHTMIEWIAPNYLGPAVEFRAKYVEPIQAGLYHDSSAYERRKSLTMLGVLKEDLSPKVCNFKNIQCPSKF
jgi:SNF2 family DNA or RNA helicase